MDHPVVVWFLSEKKAVFRNQFLTYLFEVEGFYSPFGFDVGFVCHRMAVELTVVEINEVQYAAEYGFPEIRFACAFEEYVEYKVCVFFFFESHLLSR